MEAPLDVYRAASDRRNPERPVWTVDQVTLELKSLIEGAFPSVSVEGEVVSCRPASSGHVYFSLRGRDAALPCVVFRSTARKLPRPLRNGDYVVCSGSIEVYPPHGRYQLVCSWVRLGGDGELLAALEELKRKLHAEGLFAPERKRPLPFLPRRIGVVTSHSGAAIRDIVRSINSRFPVPILLAAAPVQGDGASLALMDALHAVAAVRDVDVVVIARGGGSLQDLWSFNHEGLVRAIAACPKPVISAVGHEIDTPLTDLVADQRAPTPTAVGAAAVPVRDELLTRLDECQRRLAQALLNRVRHARTRLKGARLRLTDPRRLVRDRMLRLDDRTERLIRAMHTTLRHARTRLDADRRRLVDPRRTLAARRARLTHLESRLVAAMKGQVRHLRAHHRALARALKTLSPTAVLDRGYAIVRQPAGGVVRSWRDVTEGQTVAVLLGDGGMDAVVAAVRADDAARKEDH